MSADLLTAGLLRIAADDLAAVRLLAPSNNRNAAYLLEQAAEKVIRAVLTHEGIHGGLAHHLDEMIDRLGDAHPLKRSLRTIEHLGAYATSYRYPSSTGRVRTPPSPRELEAHLVAVEQLLRAVEQHVGLGREG